MKRSVIHYDKIRNIVMKQVNVRVFFHKLIARTNSKGDDKEMESGRDTCFAEINCRTLTRLQQRYATLK